MNSGPYRPESSPYRPHWFVCHSGHGEDRPIGWIKLCGLPGCERSEDDPIHNMTPPSGGSAVPPSVSEVIDKGLLEFSDTSLLDWLDHKSADIKCLGFSVKGQGDIRRAIRVAIRSTLQGDLPKTVLQSVQLDHQHQFVHVGLRCGGVPPAVAPVDVFFCAVCLERRAFDLKTGKEVA